MRNGGLKQKSSLHPSKGLSRGKSRLASKTRIRVHKSPSPRILGVTKIWSMDQAVKNMSEWVRNRDGECVICHTSEFLTCSHYHGCGNAATRFDPLNLDAMCLYCHMRMETEKKGEYKDYMIQKLGQEVFDKLEAKARTRVKQEDAIIEVMNFLCMRSA